MSDTILEELRKKGQPSSNQRKIKSITRIAEKEYEIKQITE
jgi:hypothetical protein